MLIVDASCSVRNHGGVPVIKEDVFELEIGGLVNKTVKISLADLKNPAKFPCVSSPHGNRSRFLRSDQSKRSYSDHSVQWYSSYRADPRIPW